MLLVDYRDGSKDLIPILPIEIVVECMLPSGDVAFSGRGPDGDVLIGVEVKKLDDLMSSETTGRLAGTQLPRMIRDYEGGQAWLLGIGRYRPGFNGRLELDRHGRWHTYSIGRTPVPFAYLESFLTEMTAIGIHIKFVADEREAVCWLLCLHNWWQKPWDQHKAMRKLDSSGLVSLMPDMNPNERQIVKTIMTFPGMGIEKAMAGLRVFGSPAAVMNGSIDQWMQVAGVGKVLARAAVEVANGR